MNIEFFASHMSELNKLYESSHLKFFFISTLASMLAGYTIVIIDNALNIDNSK